MSDVIVAQATPQGNGALAIIRLSGLLVREVTDTLVVLKSKKSVKLVPTHSVHYGDFLSPLGELIDQVVIMIMDTPRSFTGENTIEITCHNNQYIIKKIIDAFLLRGCRLAFRGEFTERAVLNEKIDLIQAEAINDLIHAQSDLATTVALRQVTGTLSHEISKIDESLVEIAAWCQASFEFLEEERDFRVEILNKIIMVKNKIQELISSHSLYKIFKEGVRISIIGSVNVGKSSLFNSLLGYNRAIVNPLAGTTRDTIEANMSFGNFNVTLIDTAGIRITNDEIEMEGIEKAYKEFELADIVILVYTESVIANKFLYEWYLSMYTKNKKKIILVKNKIDEGALINLFDEDVLVSVKEKINISSLQEKIVKVIESRYLFGSFSYVINNRQNIILIEVYTKFDNLIDLLTVVNPFYELVLYHLNDMQIKLSEMGLKSIEERSLDKVFKEFCVGK